MSLLPNVCVKGWREAELPRESLPSFLSRKRLLFVRSLFPAGDGQAQVIQMLVVRPAKPVLRGPRDLQYSGKVNLPCAKVLAYGQNACTAHSRRGPEGPFSSSSAAVPPIQNIDFNRPFHKRNLLLIEFKSGFLSVLRQFFFLKQ